jgi:hypothetical protein
MTMYAINFDERKALLLLAQSATDHAMVARLWDFEGTEEDLERAIELLGTWLLEGYGRDVRFLAMRHNYLAKQKRPTKEKTMAKTTREYDTEDDDESDYAQQVCGRNPAPRRGDIDCARAVWLPLAQ